MAETTRTTPETAQPALGAEVDEATLAEAQRYIEEEEGRTNRLDGKLGLILTLLAAAVSLFHLYAAYFIVPAYILRPVHVGLVLLLVYLLFPAAERFRGRILPWDYALAALSLGVIGYILYQGPDFGDRAILPEQIDMIVGIVFIVLLLEATRRATGMIMPAVALIFLAYAYWGPRL